MAKQVTPKTKDWHPADIVAAFKKRGTTITRVAREMNLCESYLRQATKRPYPKAERILADYLGLTPQQIWPSRYHEDGKPKSGRGERGIGRHKSYFTNKQNNTPVTNKSNVKIKSGDLQAA